MEYTVIHINVTVSEWFEALQARSRGFSRLLGFPDLCSLLVLFRFVHGFEPLGFCLLASVRVLRGFQAFDFASRGLRHSKGKALRLICCCFGQEGKPPCPVSLYRKAEA